MTNRRLSVAALVVALVALVFSMTPLADAGRRAVQRALPGPSVTPKAFGILRLNRQKRFPASVIPKVAAARRADNATRLNGRTAADYGMNCNAQTVDLGTWCLMANPFPLTNEDAGKNTYAFASAKCAEAGGWLPTAAQLVGAADRVKLASTITDSALTAAIDQDATDGLKDRREMSATLVTTAAGSSAAGSQGVSEGSRGDPKQGEPDPIPVPANPSPETLQYVTVYDNGDRGGFAGSRPISQPEQFRCAFAKEQGPARDLGEEPAGGQAPSGGGQGGGAQGGGGNDTGGRGPGTEISSAPARK